MGVKNRLKEIRMKEYMMTQTDFAEQILNLHLKQYTKYEKTTVPTLETAMEIAKKLSRSVEDIFYLEE